MDVSNSVLIIDLLISPLSDVCINLVGENYTGLVDHSDWMEEFSDNIHCDEDI